MTIHLAAAPADREAAESLAKALERRGHFVEEEDADHGRFRALSGQRVAVVVWSEAAQVSGYGDALAQRGIEAAIDGRLVLVRLDGSALPAGLIGEAAIEAPPDEERASAWETAIAATEARLANLAEAPAPPPAAPSPPPPPSFQPRPQPPRPRSRVAARLSAPLLGVSALAGLVWAAALLKLAPPIVSAPALIIGVIAALCALLLSLAALANAKS